jgi:pimeloyl-ACP methyl ester carboxylesterase
LNESGSGAGSVSDSVLSSGRLPGRGVWFRALLALVCFAAGLGVYVWLRPLQVLFALAQMSLRVQGVHSEYVRVDGYRIHCYVGGSGKPIVLVHGLGGRSEDWTVLIPELLRGGYRVYALDLLGYGRSARPQDAAYSIPQEAGIVEHFMAAEGLRQTDLAGWSMGGWIAMRAALDEPQAIRRLIVYDSAGLRFDLAYDPTVFYADTPEKLATLNQLLSPGTPPPMAGFIQSAVLRALARNRWVIQRSLQSMMAGADLFDGKVSELKMPFLIVWGKQDKITPVALGYALHAEAPQSVLEIYDGCGHLATRECVPKLGPATVDFLNASPAPASGVVEIP